ncbi:hypothetical protein PA7_10140 [Pseudonocardia asaccharolytica DSM 44247 = NBRC 16224]|uniref:Tryptophan synthase beta chain-like PALP domain-containing protein n=1 Tax=Pseudonocardia asaccharolytica DSM 44247 = NBRC 16224 TaxID=1123024 RepID=A0A511CXH4_9PSEU|nr:hypothetical protein PA7_10140 [Pseudonocardia asaccharolytica DSM 44247 = NBRC 16224]
MIRIPDAASIAAIRLLRDRTGLVAGGSTGTNLYGALRIVCEMRATGQTGSVVTLLCDAGERYAQSYFDDAWLRDNHLDIDPYRRVIERAFDTGMWVDT